MRIEYIYSVIMNNKNNRKKGCKRYVIYCGHRADRIVRFKKTFLPVHVNCVHIK